MSIDALQRRYVFTANIKKVKSRSKSNRDNSEDVTIKVKPKIIVLDMIRYPEFLNQTTIESGAYPSTTQANTRGKMLNSVLSTQTGAKSHYTVTPSKTKIPKQMSQHATPTRYRLDKKIDPKKPIFLDIFIGDSHKKAKKIKDSISRRRINNTQSVNRDFKLKSSDRNVCVLPVIHKREQRNTSTNRLR